MNIYRPQRSWGKVIFSQASQGGLAPGGMPGPRGGLVPGGAAWSRGGLLETPRDGYCCGRYASYWNAFLLSKCLESNSVNIHGSILHLL